MTPDCRPRRIIEELRETEEAEPFFFLPSRILQVFGGPDRPKCGLSSLLDNYANERARKFGFLVPSYGGPRRLFYTTVVVSPCLWRILESSVLLFFRVSYAKRVRKLIPRIGYV